MLDFDLLLLKKPNARCFVCSTDETRPFLPSWLAIVPVKKIEWLVLYIKVLLKENKCDSGLMRELIGGYEINSIKVVAAFDVDSRKLVVFMYQQKKMEFSTQKLFTCHQQLKDLRFFILGSCSSRKEAKVPGRVSLRCRSFQQSTTICR